MKILLLTYEYPPFKGGIATYLSNLMGSAPASVELIIDVPPKGEHWIKTAWRTFFLVRRVNPDLLAISHVLPAGYIAYKIKFWFKIPYLVFTHGTDILSARNNSWKRFWMRFILKRAKFVISNSRFTAGLLKEEGITKIEIIPPAIVVDLTPKPYTLNPSIISIGRLVPRKGFDTLIKAMPSVLKEIPDAQLKIIGNGDYYEELDRSAHELRVEKFVEIITTADDVAKAKELRNAAVFVLAARQVENDVEGFGIVTLEASANGLPVIVTNSGGAAEPVVTDVTGVVIRSDDSEALTAAIIKMLQNKHEAQAMGAAGREYVTKEYSINSIGKRFWSIVIPKRTGGSQSL